MTTFYSTYKSISIPQENLVDFILGSPNTTDLEKPIFVDAEDVSQCYSLSSLKGVAQAFGDWLKSSQGVLPGDVVAIFSANSIEYPMAVFGTFYAGGTATLVNPVYKEVEVAHQLRDSQAKVVFTTPELLVTALAACKLAGLSPSCVVTSATGHDIQLHNIPSVFNKGTNSLGAQDGSQASLQLKPDSIAFLCYSSGTTGLSKGVKLTHRNMIANLLQWDAGETHLSRESSLISVLPFSHIYALNVLVMNPMRRRMTSYVLPRFHPERFLALIETHRITASFIVPPIVKALLSPLAAKYDLSSLNFLCSGAAPLSPDMAKELCDRYSLPISQGFGLTETSPVLCYGRFDGSTYTGSVGRILPDIEMRIVDENGNCRGVHEEGELQVRGPNIMAGYLNNDAANENAFTVDGFFRTGDLGYVSTDGFVYVVDRIKELIKYKGFQVPPVELENLLLTHPAILDCAVIGRNCDIEVTELPTAYCVLKPATLESMHSTLPVGWTDLDGPESSLSANFLLHLAKDIINFITPKVANYKKLRGGIVFTDSIPRVPAGKILRRVLKDRTDVQFML